MVQDGLYVILPDLHFPFHDVRMTMIALDLINWIRPSGFVQLGDFVDWWQLSTYDSDPRRKDDIMDDLALYANFLDHVDNALPAGSTVHQLEGNHCDRLRRYTWRNAKGIASIVPAVSTLLNFEGRNESSTHKYIWHPYAKWNSCRLGDTVIHHGFYYDQNVAVNNLKRYPMVNLIQGHTHRFQYASNGRHFSCSLGHASLDEETGHKPAPNDWARALGILAVSAGKGHLSTFEMRENQMVVWGKTFRG